MKESQVEHAWITIDAKDQIVGRLAARVARVLMGKHKASYTPNMLCGDKVIILHASQVRFTGKKWSQKTYVRYTGYPGGQRSTTAKEMTTKHPARIVEMAVKRMLPKNKMGRAQYRSLYVYAGGKHPHDGRNPLVKNVKDL